MIDARTARKETQLHDKITKCMAIIEEGIRNAVDAGAYECRVEVPGAEYSPTVINIVESTLKIRYGYDVVAQPSDEVFQRVEPSGRFQSYKNYFFDLSWKG